MVFRWPPNPSYNFIKRVIGLPGDKIQLCRQGIVCQRYENSPVILQDSMTADNRWSLKAQEKLEDLLGVKHHIYIDQGNPAAIFMILLLPVGMYFVMGDNRDDSADSRYWGFVPDTNIVGKAVLVWLSWDSSSYKPRWNRMGRLIN